MKKDQLRKAQEGIRLQPQKEDEQVSDAEFCRSPDLWPMWPLLPMKKGWNHGLLLELSVKADDDRRLGIVEPKVYLVTPYQLARAEFRHIEAIPHVTYADMEHLLADGWRID